MNDGAAVLLSGCKCEIPPPRHVLGFSSGKLAGYALKLRANTRHSAEQVNRRRHWLLFIAPDGCADRRTGAGAQARLCSLIGRPGSEAWPWQPDPSGFRQVHRSRLFLAPSRTRQVQERARQSNCGASVSEPARDGRGGYRVVTMSEC